MRRRRRRPGSLRSRLAGVLATTVALVVLLVAGVTYGLAVHQLERGQDVSLLREATRIQRLLQSGSPYVASGSDACEYPSEPACTRVVGSTGRVESGDAALRVTAQALAVARGGPSPAYYSVDAPRRQVRVVVLPVRSGEAVMVGIPTTTIETTVVRLRIALIVLGAIGVLLSAIIGYVVATVSLRPVRSLAESVDRVALTRDPRDGVATDRDDELGRLARSFTAMLHELAEADAAQQQLIADASHELRTPLTTLRTNIALLQRGDAVPEPTRRRLRDAVDRELAELQSLVTDLVDLARGVEPHEEVSDVHLIGVVEAVVESASRHWPDVEFRLDTRSATSASVDVVHASEERLHRLVSVLLDNAGKYSTDGGVTDVVVERDGQNVVLTVADSGVGIDEHDLPRIFDRFYRSTSARRLPGSGLGLSIAHQIVTSRGGTIGARLREGGGTVIVVSLPAA